MANPISFKAPSIFTTTLAEHFVIGKDIESSLSSCANLAPPFGRFEGALKTFNDLMESYL
ncbi:MAG: hypothetical protein L7S45_06535 [Luminiphilus sp.]|nr:hypothetical protein [Luminiphilus sp.]